MKCLDAPGLVPLKGTIPTARLRPLLEAGFVARVAVTGWVHDLELRSHDAGPRGQTSCEWRQNEHSNPHNVLRFPST